MNIIKRYSNYLNLKQLIWNNLDSNGEIIIPKIYWGYYGPSLELQIYNFSKYSETLMLSSIDYPGDIFLCEMGYYTCYLPLTATSNTTVFKSLEFLHNSTKLLYYQPYSIEV